MCSVAHKWNKEGVVCAQSCESLEIHCTRCVSLTVLLVTDVNTCGARRC